MQNGNFSAFYPSGNLPTTTPLIIASSSTLDLGGVNQQIASLGGAGSVINSNTGATSVLTISPTGGSTTFNGGILGGGALGTIDLVLNGPGTLVLSGSNTYTGGTTVDAGTLAITTAGALRDGTSLTVAAGGTFVFDPAFISGSPVTGGAVSAGVAAVPEPSTLALLAAGLAAGFAVWRRRR